MFSNVIKIIYNKIVTNLNSEHNKHKKCRY